MFKKNKKSEDSLPITAAFKGILKTPLLAPTGGSLQGPPVRTRLPQLPAPGQQTLLHRSLYD